MPRDRAGTFDPAVVPKHARRLAGFDEAVISLYAKGMTTGDIAAHLAEVYGTEVSRDLISRVTDAVVVDMTQWQSRPLDAVYPVMLIDAIVLKVRANADPRRGRDVANRPVYVAMGISLDGERDVLGMWVGPTGGEGAKQWLSMLDRAAQPWRPRRVHRLLRRSQGPAGRDRRDLAAGDGPDVRGASGPQQPAVRLQEGLGAVTAGLKPVYTAPTVAAAETRFAEFAEAGGTDTRR